MMKSILLFLFIPSTLAAQNRITLDEALRFSLERNPSIKAAEFSTAREEALRGASVELPKTSVSLLYGQYNTYQNDNNITVTQQIPFPTVFGAQHKTTAARIEVAQMQESVTKSQLLFELRRTFNQLLYLEENRRLLEEQDSLFQELSRIAHIQYRTGEGTLLQVTAAEAQAMEVKHRLQRNEADHATALRQLRMYCLNDSIMGVNAELRNFLPQLASNENRVDQNPTLLAARKNIELKNRERRLEGAKLYPDLQVGFFSQTLQGPQQVNGVEEYFDGSTRFTGVQVGIAVPLFFNAGRARVRAADAEASLAEKQYEAESLAITRNLYLEIQQLEKNRMSITYYETGALKHSDLLVEQSQKAFKEGEIDYSTLLLSIKQALMAREGYLSALSDYNESTIFVLFLTGK